MDLEEISKIQMDFDYNHGWPNEKEPIDIFINNLQKDIVGLVGELGEFSNIVKKIQLEIDADLLDEAKLLLLKQEGMLKEEIVDMFIYLIRLSNYFDMNLSESYLLKYKTNKTRFKKYE